MTASRRYLPASLACLFTLSAGSAGFAAGGSGSALDPYSTIQAPTTLKGAKKDDKGKKQHKIPLIKKAQAEEKVVQQDDPGQSQTFVKMPGSAKSKKAREITLTPEPEVRKEPKAKKAAPASTTTKVSDIAPAPAKDKAPVVSGQNDESVMGGIKTIGEGYSKTFKAATHGVMHSTKAASDAVLAGSKKMTDGIKSGAKASGDAFKHGADVVGHGFKATGDKIKDSAAPLTNKIAKVGGEKEKAPKEEKAKADDSKQQKIAKATKAPKEAKITDDQDLPKQGMLAHLPKPKMPKLGNPFGGKKKAPVVDQQAGASEMGTTANLAAKPKQTPVVDTAKKETPIVDTPITAEAPAAPKAKGKDKEKDKAKAPGQGLAAMPGNAAKKIGKLWPFGHKNAAPAAQGTDVAGKQTQPQL
jgi:hypothetical protein